jgi:hypothetical protein
MTQLPRTQRHKSHKSQVFKDTEFDWDSDVTNFFLQMTINSMPTFLQTDKVRFMAIDLLLMRPCIEHYMLAVIMGVWAEEVARRNWALHSGDRQSSPATMTRNMVFGA